MSRRARIVVPVLLACTICHLVVLRSFVVERRLALGQVQRGYFEEFGARIGLALVDVRADTGFPEALGRDPEGNLSVSPGLSAALPLDVVGGYRIATVGGTLTPNLIVGREVAPAPSPFPVEPSATAPEAVLTDAQELDVVDGRLRFVPWNVAKPWRTESERLARVARACSADASTAAFTVALERDRLSMHFGTCSVEEGLARESSGRPVVVVMAGPSWDLIERTGSAWQNETRLSSVVWKATAVAVVAAAGLLWVFGPLTALSTSLALALPSVWYEPTAVVCLAIVLLGILLYGGWVLVRLGIPHLPTRAVAVVSLLLLAVVIFRWLHGAGEPTAVEQPSVSHACLFTGYSAAGDSGLRPGMHGIGRLLQEKCAPCGQSVTTEARPGRTFAVIRDIGCTSPAPVRRGGTLLFFGGSNDDFMSWLVTQSSFLQVLYQLRSFVAQIYYWKPGVDTVLRLMRDTSAASLRVVDEQAAILRGLADCATRGDFGLLFYQDFVVLDLDGGRLDARTTMIARRRIAIEEGGAQFVDLLETFRDEAGIYWFNDLMHASIVGHRRITELMCNMIERPAAD